MYSYYFHSLVPVYGYYQDREEGLFLLMVSFKRENPILYVTD